VVAPPVAGKRGVTNRGDVATALTSQLELRKNEEAAIQFIDELQAHTVKGHHKRSFVYVLALPRDTRWNTAQAAVAVAYMPCQDVQKYAEVYVLQRKFGDIEDRLGETVTLAEPLARGLKDEYDKALR
jgi:hypothetical protein